VVEICNILNKEPYCAHVATRVIATKIQSPQEWEALQALNVSILTALYRQMSTGVPLAKEMITEEQNSNVGVAVMLPSVDIIENILSTCMIVMADAKIKIIFLV
jgi:hypothetical protein